VSQNHYDGFLFCTSKSSRFWFVGCAIKPTGGCDVVGHTSRSSGLLHVEANLASVSQSGLEIGRGAMVGGARGTITEVALELS
jgi:hypothetical protein